MDSETVEIILMPKRSDLMDDRIATGGWGGEAS
jgi:hypothetical protein